VPYDDEISFSLRFVGDFRRGNIAPISRTPDCSDVTIPRIKRVAASDVDP
jgi:hypothetical protein